MLVRVLVYVVNRVMIALDPCRSRVRDVLLLSMTCRIVVKAFVALLLVGSLVFFAALAYAAFYWVYVPEIAHRAPVYLQYPDDASAGTGSGTRLPPTGVVDVTGANAPFLVAGQEYDVLVEFVIPRSERNAQHGNFMVRLRLLDEKGVAVAGSSRPQTTHLHDSFLVRTMKTIWLAVPLTFGFTTESQKLAVSLLEGFVESAADRVTRAEVSVSSPHLQIYSVQLLFHAHFRGLRYFMYYLRIPTALVFITSFLFWEMLFALLGWRAVVGWWQAETIPPQHRKTANVPVCRTHAATTATIWGAPREQQPARLAEFSMTREFTTETAAVTSTAQPSVLETLSDEDTTAEMLQRGQLQAGSEDLEAGGSWKRRNNQESQDSGWFS
ncbi:MAG: putative adipose-regulatory protein-domain-containing protein [Olpidium bornovanus]|uniref:Adipose-regulatory protein-domain-containing protein n=1 Tax=Olpidium bornovanus TaxID=278681 RepID=A0A8H8DLN1_9FUNG|nr:MAG: putative adipose-regulatory protein-domain-containing protein [Olpidium bornovanus]